MICGAVVEEEKEEAETEEKIPWIAPEMPPEEERTAKAREKPIGRQKGKPSIAKRICVAKDFFRRWERVKDVKVKGTEPGTTEAVWTWPPQIKVVGTNKASLKLEDLDGTDKKILIAMLDNSKTVLELNRGLGIPLVVCYSKVLRLETIGAIEFVGKVVTSNSKKARKAYRCSGESSQLIRGMSIKNSKKGEQVLAES